MKIRITSLCKSIVTSFHSQLRVDDLFHCSSMYMYNVYLCRKTDQQYSSHPLTQINLNQVYTVRKKFWQISKKEIRRIFWTIDCPYFHKLYVILILSHFFRIMCVIKPIKISLPLQNCHCLIIISFLFFTLSDSGFISQILIGCSKCWH